MLAQQTEQQRIAQQQAALYTNEHIYVVDMFPWLDPTTIRQVCDDPQFIDTEAVIHQLLQLVQTNNMAMVGGWTCAICTLINAVSANVCDMCGSEQPSHLRQPAVNSQASIPVHQQSPPDNVTAANRRVWRTAVDRAQAQQQTNNASMCVPYGTRFSRRSTATGFIWQ